MALAVAILFGSQAQAGDALYKTFAGCAARYSATMEHAWLMGNDAAKYKEHRLTFLSLLDATLPPERGAEALNHRVAVKMAQATLLTAASFSDNTDKAERAKILSEQYLAQCERLLLDS
ncbi:MAG: hypothetical protein AAGI10_09335 [Pseudomonadota bacterium]